MRWAHCQHCRAYTWWVRFEGTEVHADVCSVCRLHEYAAAATVTLAAETRVPVLRYTPLPEERPRQKPICQISQSPPGWCVVDTVWSALAYGAGDRAAADEWERRSGTVKGFEAKYLLAHEYVEFR